MRRGRDSQVLQHLGGIVTDNGLPRRVGNTIGVSPSVRAASSISTARRHNGTTRCSRLAFIRVGGIVHRADQVDLGPLRLAHLARARRRQNPELAATGDEAIRMTVVEYGRSPAVSRQMTTPYDPNSPLWWGIDPDGRPNAKKLSEIVETMVRIARPEKIILFGSGARGRMNAHSDLDFLLIKNDTQPRATARRIRRQAPRGRPPLDILIASREDVERNRHNPSFVIHDALKEGRVLYDDRAERR